MHSELEKATIGPEALDSMRKSAEELYKTIGKVYCPYLHEDVVFNAKGLEHLKFKGRNKARPHADQYVRFKLLKLAPEIIRKSHTIQELSEGKVLERLKKGARWESILVDVTYYGFVAIINGARIKVVVKQVGDGQKFFWSLVPFWKSNQKNSGNKKILHAGNPEED